MKIYDITQELFSCQVYPGDTTPEMKPALRIVDGAACNLTDMTLCLHNGTHIDAPFHFFSDGKTIDQLELSKCMGRAAVREFSGALTAENASDLILDKPERLLIKGSAVITPEAAQLFADSEIFLIGVEPQSVSDAENTVEVHRILLGAEIVIVEGLVLCDVPCGEYYLSALPLRLGDADGSPCRAVLTEI